MSNYIDPEGLRHPSDKLGNIGRTILEKRKVAAMAPIGAQLLHDMEISVLEDVMLDTVLLKLESFVLEEKVAHGVEKVPFHKSQWVEYPAYKPSILVVLTTFAVSLVLMLLGASPLLLLIPLAAFSAEAIGYYSRYGSHGEYVTVSGEVEFEVDSLIRFPENNKVFPKEMGRPYKAVEVRHYARYDEEER